MKTKIIIAIVGIIVIVVGAWWYISQPAMYAHELAPGENIASWDFKGVYMDNAELEQKAKAEIARLKKLFNEEGYTDYELYVSLANQYELLGLGKETYDNLRKALAIDSESTGLAWHNMGNLMERLGAYESARVGLENAIKAQPQLMYYHTALIDFLKMRMPEDTESIAQEEAALNAITGEFIFE